MHLLFLAVVLSVKLVVQRSSLDLLDSLPIAVVVENAAAAPQTVRFPQPAEYAIELRAPNGTVIWSTPRSTAGNAPAFPPHARTFAPGSTTLAVYDWNALLPDGTSPPAGSYTLRARLVSEKPAESSIHVTFAPPISPSSVGALRLGEEFTLAGTLDAQHATLSDQRGSATLSRRLFAAPAGVPIVARGFAEALPGGVRVFTVERWAPANVQPASAR